MEFEQDISRYGFISLTKTNDLSLRIWESEISRFLPEGPPSSKCGRGFLPGRNRFCLHSQKYDIMKMNDTHVRGGGNIS